MTRQSETHRGRWSASRAGCGEQWPRRWCWGPPGWAPSGRRCPSSPCGGWRCATCALCAAGRQRGLDGRCGSSSWTATCLGGKKRVRRSVRIGKCWASDGLEAKASTHWLWTCRWTSRPPVLLSWRRSSYWPALTLHMSQQNVRPPPQRGALARSNLQAGFFSFFFLARLH